MSLEYQPPSSVEILGSRVSRDSCPQTMLDLRGSFQLSGLKGLVSIRCKEREGCTRPCSCSSLLFLVGRRAAIREGKLQSSREISSNTVTLHPSTLVVSFSFRFFLWPPSSRFLFQFLDTSWRHSLALFREG